MSDSDKIPSLCRTTVLHNKFAQEAVSFPSANNRQTNMASSDTNDDIIISSALLITLTLYRRHQVNVRKCKKNSWAHEWITAQ